jgi:hypothetical protein
MGQLTYQSPSSLMMMVKVMAFSQKLLFLTHEISKVNCHLSNNKCVFVEREITHK